MNIFPLALRAGLGAAWRAFPEIEEIRVRACQPMILSAGQEEWFFTMQPGGLTHDSKAAYTAAPQDISDMLTFISRYSLFAFEEEVRSGFLTLEGGHRVGVGGQAVYQDGKLQTIRNISSLNIRICREKKGCATHLLPHLYKYPSRRQSGIYNTLLLSPPGKGKTTLLRDMIRLLSDGAAGHAGLRVSVVDERSELAGCYRGIPQNDVGIRTDVLDSCPKSDGMMRLIRAMSPQVVAVDELGSKEDVQAVSDVIRCGCSILGSVHAENLGDLAQKPSLRVFLEQGYFERYLVIGQQEDGTRTYRLYDERQEPVC